MKLNVVIFDIVPTNAVRFFIKFIEEFSKDFDISLTFLIEHDDALSIDDIDNFYPMVDKKICSQFFSINKIHKLLVDGNFDFALINGQRIPDDRFVVACKKSSTPVFMIQHGMYLPFLKRNPRFFLSKIKKTFSYLFYALDISLSLNSFSIFIKYFASYVLGKNQVDISIPRILLNADKVFVYSEYWADFHKSQFGYSDDDMVVVGTPDLYSVACADFFNDKNSVCYIAQTLVEDGRLSKNIFSNFLVTLIDYCAFNNKKLFIKIHPRSDLSLYKHVSGLDFVHFVNEIPSSTLFVGHYSSLLVVPLSLTSVSTLLIRFPGHDIPQYFSSSADYVLDYLDKNNPYCKLNNKANIDFYFHKNSYLYSDFVLNIIKLIK